MKTRTPVGIAGLSLMMFFIFQSIHLSGQSEFHSPRLMINSILDETAEEQGIGSVYEILVDVNGDSLKLQSRRAYNDAGKIALIADFQEDTSSTFTGEVLLSQTVTKNHITKFTYDKEGSLLSEVNSYERDGEKIQRESYFKYDRNLLMKQWGEDTIIHEKTALLTIISYETKYEYNTEGVLKKVESSVGTVVGDYGYELIRTTVRSYDRGGTLKEDSTFLQTRNAFLLDENDEKALASLCQYFYDENGRIAKVINVSMPEADEFYTLKLERDDAGRISKMEEYSNFNPQEEHFTEWSLFYDLSGKLLKVNKVERDKVTERVVFRYE